MEPLIRSRRLCGVCQAALAARRTRRVILPPGRVPSARTYADAAGTRLSPLDTSDGWRTVIGLEIHAQLRTGRKLFSDSPLAHNAPPNTLVDQYDAAFPGSLPVLDKEAVRLSLLTALALKCTINPRSTFDRKHYFYHDIPASYQITQHYSKFEFWRWSDPLARNGYLELPTIPSTSTSTPSSSPSSSLTDPSASSSLPNKRVRIHQLQIEQDTAKSQTVADDVLVDLNRAGTGLMEIVTEPDMSSTEEAGAFVRRLQGLLRRIGSGDGDMEKGNLRIDANVSVHRVGSPYGTRCEIKNLNSVRFLQTAIAYETRRHIRHYETTTAPLLQETRQVNESTGETYPLRSKEEAMDYRYMPDPNLPALLFQPDTIRRLEAKMPEMPWMTVQRLLSAHEGLEPRDVETMISLDEYDGGGVRYFEDVLASMPRQREDGGKRGKKVVNWMTHEVLGQLGKSGVSWNERIVPPGLLGEIVHSIEEGRISGTTGKAVIRHLIGEVDGTRTENLDQLLSRLGLAPSAAGGGGDLDELCKQAIQSCKKEAEMVRKGNEKVAMRLVGEVMKLSQGRADAKKAREVILQMLRA